MTVREAYEYILMELNKVKSPHIHLEEFLYFMNKAIQEYVNKRYSKYATSQQLSDDLAVLSRSVDITIDIPNNISTITDGVTGTIIESNNVNTTTKYGSSAVVFKLPEEYLHLLLAYADITSYIPYKCFGPGYVFTNPAKRYPSDIAGGTMKNSFQKPAITRPYHQINDNVSSGIVTPMMTIMYGLHPVNKFSLTKVSLDYLKKPEVISLTIAERDAIIDNSAVMEFPEYVCKEIIKESVALILENSSNPRLQTNIPVNRSINP